MLEWIKGVWQKYQELCQKLGDKINFSAEIISWIGVGVVALVFLLIVTIIIVAIAKSKKKKKKKLAQEQAKLAQDKEEDQQEQAIIEQPANETVAVVEEEAEEKIDEKIVVEGEQPVVEEVASVETVTEEQPVVEVPAKEEVVKKAPATKKTKAPAKKTTQKKTEKTADKPAKKLNGKWAVEIKRAGEFVSKLTASNGEVMLYSETYTTEEGARNGISTIIKGLENGKVVLYQVKNGNYYAKIKTSNNRLLCVGEIYKSKEQCLKAIETVKRIAPASVISPELVEGARYIEYTPAPMDESKKSLRGKWKIENTEEGKFVARLYASNGQMMLTTEEVANKKTAENAVESVKKNASEGNFIIDKDKFGRFYYKLRNAQKSIICIGEAYESLDSCVSAIESVRRFSLSSSIVTQ